MNYNKLIVAGHLSRDTELRTTQSGTVMCVGGIAVSKRKKDKSDDVLWLDWIAFGKTAELMAQFLKKGSGCLLDGELQYQTWQDKDGNKRSKHQMLVNNVVFGDKPKASGGKPGPKPAETGNEFEGVTDDGLPPF